MKYKAIIETDDFEDFQFFEDSCGKYIRGIDGGAVSNEWIPLYFTECEQEPCEDCISRQEVLEIAKSSKSNWIDNSVLFKKVNELPPVTPKQKIGHWIKYGVPRCGEQHYQCTSCGYYINFGQWGELYTKEFKYCPNCMARMQEVEDNG